MQVLCDNPKIILNPLLPQLLSQFGVYFIKGVKYVCRDKSYYFRKIEELPFILSAKYNNVTKDDLDNCYVLDDVSGETFPFYLEVPCGKCDNCRATKVSSFVHRCKLESMYYKCKPLFLTLTYDEEHKPKDGVSLRHVQLFFKRLRINLQRNGFFDYVRYVCVSEYGKTTSLRKGRPHYHAILWNCHATDLVSYTKIREIIGKSWGQGFVYVRFVDLGNDKAFYYTSKYLSKGCNVPEGQNPTFMVSSNRKGGIGAPFIDQLSDHIYNKFDTSPSFLNSWSGKVEKLCFNKYVLNRLFPSLSSFLSSKVKVSVRRFVLNYRLLLKYFHPSSVSISSFFDDVKQRFSKLFYIFDPCSDIPNRFYKKYNVLIREFIEDIEVITRCFLRGDSFFERCQFIIDKRDLFLSKLFRVEHNVSLHDRRLRFLRAESITQSRLVL